MLDDILYAHSTQRMVTALHGAITVLVLTALDGLRLNAARAVSVVDGGSSSKQTRSYTGSMDVLETYKALWARVEAESNPTCILRYEGLGGPDRIDEEVGEGGDFVLDDGHPRIRIFRKYYSIDNITPSFERNGHPPVNGLAELATLAHEYGHFLSWKGRAHEPDPTRWDRQQECRFTWDKVWKELEGLAGERDESDREISVPFRQRIVRELTAAQFDLIEEEEELAWANGRKELENLGWTDFELYRKREIMSLHNYRYRMGRDELWPGDQVLQPFVP
jgi:hypothetical protein